MFGTRVSGLDCNFCSTHSVALGFCSPAGGPARRERDQCGSGQQPLIQETSFLLDTEDFSNGMCRFRFGSTTPKGGVNIWYRIEPSCFFQMYAGIRPFCTCGTIVHWMMLL